MLIDVTNYDLPNGRYFFASAIISSKLMRRGNSRSEKLFDRIAHNGIHMSYDIGT